ncbi:putative reverse transcriptase domain-containing protein [Tanacetum coccineum]
MRQRRWIELFSDYDCKIRYHSGKANVVADALSRNETVKPKRVRALNMTLKSSIKDRILAAQKEAMDESVGLHKDVAHNLKYFIHPGVDKMYYDLRDRYWWPSMKKDIVVYDYKTDRLARLYLTQIVARHGVPISIISDRDSRFTSRFWQSMQEALGTRLDMSMAYHPQTDGQSERTIQTLEDMLRAKPVDAPAICRSRETNVPEVDCRTEQHHEIKRHVEPPQHSKSNHTSRITTSKSNRIGNTEEMGFIVIWKGYSKRKPM